MGGIAADIEIDATAAGAIERALGSIALGGSGLVRIVNGHGLAVHGGVELPGGGQNRVADLFGFETPRGELARPIGRREHQAAQHLLNGPAIAHKLRGQRVE